MLKVVSRKALRFLDRRRSTYAESAPEGELASYFPAPLTDWLEPSGTVIRALARFGLDHRFDLLGSGWVKVTASMSHRGLLGKRFDTSAGARPEDSGEVNKANGEEAARIRGLVDEGYDPIPWHTDFKSGYRWDPDIWYQDIPVGQREGADVNVVWELSRMQHLPQLALAHGLAESGTSGFEEGGVYATEFRNQVLDFIGSNPPRWGVNWACAMDVAIRAANWLVTHDLFRSLGARFDPEFEEVFKRSILEHGRHLLENLEWHPEFRGNHYLADVAGLLFIGAYLPQTEEVDAWLAFAHKELVQEVQHQFHDDGGNFEGSTCYHRLSTELALYSTALVLALPEERSASFEKTDDRLFPPLHFERIEKAGEFILHIVKPCGQVPQIGDNDSGRFLKLQPAMTSVTTAQARKRFSNLEGFSQLADDDPFWIEDTLDHRHIASALSGLFRREDFLLFGGARGLE
ncbi:MAG: heparinase II/III family protein, partial [Planctomycetota bacterium]